MKSVVAAATLAAVVPVVLGQTPLMVNSLNGVVACEPIMFTWSGGVPPYYVSLIPASQPAAPPMKVFPAQQGTSFSWKVDLGAGTTFNTMIKDGTGQPNYSSEQTVQAGPDSSCVNSTVTEGGSAGTAPPTSAATGTPTPAAAAAITGTGSISASTTHSTSASSTGASHGSSSVTATGTSNAAASTTSSSNGASQGSSMGAFGLAGIVGLIGAAFL